MAFFGLQMLHENEFEMSAVSYLLHIFVSVIKNVDAQSLTVFFFFLAVVVLLTLTGNKPNIDVESPPQWSHRVKLLIFVVYTKANGNACGYQNSTRQKQNRIDLHCPTQYPPHNSKMTKDTLKQFIFVA